MTFNFERIALGQALIARESMYLDDQRWDDWLALYQPDCEFWMPMWRDDSTLNDDPHTTLSYIYYSDRKGLEDRVSKLRSPRAAPAVEPMPRTAHTVSNVLALNTDDAANTLHVRSTWTCHVLYTRSRTQHVFFGSSEYEFTHSGNDWLIARKRIVLQNDDIPSMLDFYCV